MFVMRLLCGFWCLRFWCSLSKTVQRPLDSVNIVYVTLGHRYLTCWLFNLCAC